ncbi:outer membrane biogenesis protein BamB [Pseudobythopirellula maris]|uniref:Outer membrane biogenesis protein BamB n=1 Tax=Pseudobythopirellula maris TaxID=2527991 RepID=A0A5C5ZRV0_9BACT|nr:PQQ-binding-like beta-propeller repeat protein [Pseudobythopirellula maris]TWT90020.1 outer membrane biogenesis protein BamB [Pseudobythopirellula maris]
MTAEDFIQILDRQEPLSDALRQSLLRTVASSPRPVSPFELGRLLVKKGYLDSDRVNQALATLEEEASPPPPPTPPPAAPLGPPPSSSKTLDAFVERPESSDIHDESIVFDESQRKELESSLSQTSSGSVVSQVESQARRKTLKKPKGNEFDSPLMLLGGGALVLLVLGGAVMAYLLGRESGDKLLLDATTQFESGAYSQAIAQYERFVEKHVSHHAIGEARVRLFLARLRQAVEVNNDPASALQIAQSSLPEVEDIEEFGEARPELAALLPDIALKLTEIAERVSDEATSALDAGDAGEAPGAGATDSAVELATEAIALASNTKYVPKSLRDERDYQAARETLQRIARRREAQVELAAAIGAMREAIAAGDPATAYSRYDALLRSRPELAESAPLEKALMAAAEAERGVVNYEAISKPAETLEAASPVVAAAAAANQRVKGVSRDTGVYAIRVKGIAYGVNVADGALLWRRPVGATASGWRSVAVDDDLLMLDTRSDELLRVNARSGELRWRQSVDVGATTPVVLGERVLVATASGSMLVIDAAQGALVGRVTFAQPIRLPPAVSRDGDRVYLVGEHSIVYTLAADSFECLGAYYLGHETGAITAPPAVTLHNHVAVAVNDGLETSRAMLLGVGSDGVIERLLDAERMEGLVRTAPLIAGRLLTYVTNKGEIRVYEIGPANEPSPLKPLAGRNATANASVKRRNVIRAGSALWISSDRLVKCVPSLSSSQLNVQQIEEPFAGDEFLGEMQVHRSTLIHARRRRGSDSVTVAASEVESGAVVWETDLAAPPAGEPRADSPAGAMLPLSEGRPLTLGKPLPLGPHDSSRYDAAITLANGAMVFTKVGSDRITTVTFDASGPRSTRHTLDDALACRPIAAGDAWLASFELGQICLLDESGMPVAAPFQAPAEPGVPAAWLGAQQAGPDRPEFVVPQATGVVRLLRLNDGPARGLVELASVDLEARVVSDAAVAGASVAVVLEGGRLARLALAGLQSEGVVDVGPVVWGPYAIGERFVVGAAEGDLVAIAASGPLAVEWRTPAPSGRPVGAPALDDRGRMLVATDRGEIGLYSAATGEAAGASITLGQSLASGPVSRGDSWLLAAQDGSMLSVVAP